jgi:hypothetical protein
MKMTEKMRQSLVLLGSCKGNVGELNRVRVPNDRSEDHLKGILHRTWSQK